MKQSCSSKVRPKFVRGAPQVSNIKFRGCRMLLSFHALPIYFMRLYAVISYFIY
jgi:hypothetical protein